ncbi:MAG: sarcosine oxidase subunit alpha family protein, partial [Pseudomonadota bacterium]
MTARLENQGRIDHDQPITITYNGKQYPAYVGDTIASALLANDVKVIGRSWKYHRARGFMGDGAEEANGLFQVETGARTIPNVRGTQAEVYDGMVFTSTNAWPSPNFDLLAIFGKFSFMLPAGFYYKTFMWPAKFWMLYEHFIRKASGLGKSPSEVDVDHYEKTNEHCDVLVIGAGPAGLMAAMSAAKSGARVLIADEQAEFGGRLLSESAEIEGQASGAWLESTVAALKAMDDVTMLTRSTVFGYYDANFLSIVEKRHDHLPIAARKGPRERVWRVRAKHVIIASGAHERPIPFGYNDRAGVMLASAVSTYLQRYSVKLSERAVVFTNNDSAYQTAIDLHTAGVTVAAIVDSRSSGGGELMQQALSLGLNILTGSVVVKSNGGKKVKGAVVQSIAEDAKSLTGEPRHFDCDLIAVSGGWNPAIHMLAQSGGKVQWNDSKVCFEPSLSVQTQTSVGAANAEFDLAACLADGASVGAAVATSLGFEGKQADTPKVVTLDQSPIEPLWRIPINADKPWDGPKQFVDFQNDVGVADIHLAVREGFQSVEHVKRYTALGFGTDQGKTGNIVGMAVLADALDKDIQSTGTTTFRPNYTPVTFGAVAGAEINGTLFDPVRKTAMHGWHEEHGALFENVGQWHRPWYYPQGNETLQEAVDRECLATRTSVGIMDASTLGKIEIKGKDAAEFLERIYTNNWKKLKVGMARYGFMLGEDGMVMDDGVTVRFAEDHFFMHTTTGGAAGVMNWLELWSQTEWPELEVYMTSVTDHWATAAVVGPNSRKVVSAVVKDIDFDREAFPFMATREGHIDGVPVRVNRISFSGELAYEVNVNANQGRFVWEKLWQAGEPYNITAYGTESLHVLRAEKGYVIVGQDTDGSVSVEDLGMQWALSKTKDYLGRRSMALEELSREDRKQFVGLLTVDPKLVLEEGGQIIDTPSNQIPVPMIGHVTSSYWSACAERSIALALVRGGHQRHGETIYVAMNDGRTVPAVIGSTVFIDPEGERQQVMGHQHPHNLPALAHNRLDPVVVVADTP